MKKIYKGCEIEVTKESGTLYYSIFDDGYEVVSSFSEGEDTVRDMLKSLEKVVDDYLEHPEEYK